MEIKLMVISAAVVVSLVACGQKTDSAAKVTETSKGAEQRGREEVRQLSGDVAASKPQQVGNGGVKAAGEMAASAKEGAKKSSAAVKDPTEQALAETIAHAQEVTRTQSSGARLRGQKAEDEMMMEAERGK